jgi:peptidoglycan/LPS O-acetylase OafA/YrhL
MHMGGSPSQWGLFAPIMSVAGFVAVSFFFFLSGYILTYSHVDEYEKGKGSAPKFWIARIRRRERTRYWPSPHSGFWLWRCLCLR